MAGGVFGSGEQRCVWLLVFVVSQTEGADLQYVQRNGFNHFLRPRKTSHVPEKNNQLSRFAQDSRGCNSLKTTLHEINTQYHRDMLKLNMAWGIGRDYL